MIFFCSVNDSSSHRTLVISIAFFHGWQLKAACVRRHAEPRLPESMAEHGCVIYTCLGALQSGTESKLIHSFLVKVRVPGAATDWRLGFRAAYIIISLRLTPEDFLVQDAGLYQFILEASIELFVSGVLELPRLIWLINLDEVARL